jgi:hypothetical protein
MLKNTNKHAHFRLIRGFAGLVCGAAVALAGALGAPGAAAAATSCPLSEMTSASQPACFVPFSAVSPFNTPIPANQVLAADNAAVVAHMSTYDWSIDGFNSEFDFNPDALGTRSIFYASPSDPTMTIHCKNDAGVGSCKGTNGVNTDGEKINVPAGAVPFANADAHMTVIETATGQEYDFWDTSVSGSTINAGTGAELSMSGDGLGSWGDNGQFALAAGLVRPAELAAGQINHALVVTVPCVNASGASGFAWPAQGGYGSPCGEGWSESTVGAPQMGQLLRLNMTAAQIAASPAPAWQKTIMTAFSTYGAYIEDTDGNQAAGIDILTQGGSSWTDLGMPDPWLAVTQQFGSANGDLVSSVPIPVSQLQVVKPCYPEGSCPVPTAAATPVAAPPPPAPAAPVVPKQKTTPKHTTTHKHTTAHKHKKHKTAHKHKKHKTAHKHKKHKTSHKHKSKRHRHHKPHPLPTVLRQ